MAQLFFHIFIFVQINAQTNLLRSGKVVIKCSISISIHLLVLYDVYALPESEITLFGRIYFFIWLLWREKIENIKNEIWLSLH